MPWAKMVYWMYCIEVDEKLNISAKKIIEELSKNGIGARPFFLGLHQQPIMLKMGYSKKDKRMPVTERIAKQGLYLPSGINLKKPQINYIIGKLSEIIKVVL